MWESVEHGPLLLCAKSPEGFIVKGRKHAPFVYRLGGRSGEEVKVGFHTPPHLLPLWLPHHYYLVFQENKVTFIETNLLAKQINVPVNLSYQCI